MRKTQLPSVSIILLAAGRSSRLGKPKQLLPYKGTTLLRYAASTALSSQADSTYVILGSEAEKLKGELHGLPVQVVNNPDWGLGISTSIVTGVRALPQSVDAALIMLCDQPRVSTQLLDSIIENHRSAGKPVVACEYGGTLGVPALFARSLFPELVKLKGDQGAKSVIQKHTTDAIAIPFPDGIFDIDELQHT